MCRLGELERGVLFAFDQNAAVWDEDEAMQSRPDAAVLIEFGRAAPSRADGGAARVAELTDVRAGDTGFPSPARVLEETLARHPDARPLIGAELAAELPVGPQGTELPNAELSSAELWSTGLSSAELWSTGLWAALAQLWPIHEPVLLADYHAVGGVFHSCLLVPDAE
jgi:hypothetical protein